MNAPLLSRALSHACRVLTRHLLELRRVQPKSDDGLAGAMGALTTGLSVFAEVTTRVVVKARDSIQEAVIDPTRQKV